MFVCKPDDIPEREARGFRMNTDSGVIELLVIRYKSGFCAYVNRCPHTGVNLDWMPDEFLDQTGDLIICATHGARFRVTDGYCIQGPCAGDSLTPVALRIAADGIYLAEG